MNCASVREVGRRFLNLRPCQVNMHTFMLCNPTVATLEDLAAAALLVYATYTATNHQRYHTALGRHDLYDAMVQWVREGARGHPRATSILRARWSLGRNADNVTTNTDDMHVQRQADESTNIESNHASAPSAELNTRAAGH